MKSFPAVIVAVSYFLTLPLLAADYGRKDIKKMQWGDTEVVWLQDNRFPTYSLSIYFADGALRDTQDDFTLSGLTEATFSLMASGTRRFNQREISDNLEYYGISHGAHVSHEYLSYSVEGLVKDIVPTMKKICHLFKDASYPTGEIKNYKKRQRSYLLSLEGNHRALSSRAFREISLKETPFQYPVDGKLAHIKKITQSKLKKNLQYFNQKVKKRIYLYGPQQVLNVKNILLEECGWNMDANFVRKVDFQKTFSAKGPQIYLVTIPAANQVPIMIGRYLNKSEASESELQTLMTSLLGSGFNSLLMKELRVKRGLVYFVHSTASEQKDYGRAVISTATKNENLTELLRITKTNLDDVANNKFSKDFFRDKKKYVIGSYPFRFEKGAAYISQLAMLDHLEKDYKELFLFPKKVKKYTPKDVAYEAKRIFSWNKQTIMILGPRNLKKSLKEFGSVKVINYKKFL